MGKFNRPVAVRPQYHRRDVQQDLPFAWCEVCGMEVWKQGMSLCEKCADYQCHSGEASGQSKAGGAVGAVTLAGASPRPTGAEEALRRSKAGCAVQAASAREGQDPPLRVRTV